MKKISIIAFFAFALIGCEKEIKLDQEETTPRIVVNSIFAANDTLWLDLSESRPVLYESVLPRIITATAQLLDASGNVLGDFTHDGEGYYYLASPLTQAGNTYQLKVSAPGFESITSSSYTPDIINITSIDSTSAIANNGQIKFNINFTDKAAETNYYGISVNKWSLYYDPESNTTQLYNNPYFSTKEIYVSNGSQDIDGTNYSNEFYFSDESFNGQHVNFECLHEYYPFDSAFYVFRLYSLSEDLYKYKVSYSKYLDAKNDFFAEPVRVYSNIDKGFGIFGGASYSTDTLFTY